MVRAKDAEYVDWLKDLRGSGRRRASLTDS